MINRKKQGLSSRERLKSKKDFEELYSSGTILLTKSKKLKAIFLSVKDSDNPGIKIAAVVPKRLGNAVWRNRVKRLIKEAYRLNKNILVEKFVAKKKLMKIVFSANIINEEENKKIKLSEIMPEVTEIMKKILKK